MNKKEDLGKTSSSSQKRPPSSMSTESADSGVFSSGVHVSSHSQQSSSGSQSGPASPTAQLNSLLFQTANLIAVNEQLRKEIAENKQIQNIQMRALNRLSSSSTANTPPPDQLQSFVGSPVASHQPPPPFPHAHSQRLPRERRMQKPESYKTVICQAWLESKTCTFAENCRFAHGEDELRPSKIEPRQNNKYKTKLCDKYTTTGLCPYGKRCLFIHPDHGPNAYIRADKLFEVSQRHALADLRDQMETQIMTGGRNSSISHSHSHSHPNHHDQFLSIPPVPSSRSPIQNESTRPHPSWPLDNSSYFAPEVPYSRHQKAAANRAMSPLFSTSGNAAIQPYFLSARQPAPEVSFPVNTVLPAVRPPPEDDAMSTIPGFDHLAEDMAKHLELW